MSIRNSLVIVLCVFVAQPLASQIFTRVTLGHIVNDLGSSFGQSICDFNNDGWEDIFVTNLASGQDNFFYKNNGDGTFSRMPELAIVETKASTSSSWGDFNNDGYMDVYVANGGTLSSYTQNFLYINNGDETFTQIFEGELVNARSAHTVCSWLDVDNDGDLDLFVGSASDTNTIYINDGFGAFTTEFINDVGGTWGVSWSDYDKDGDLDGFGANWGASNYFYVNDAGALSNTPLLPLTDGQHNSLSASWGDYDNDGWMDLFVANSAARDRLFHNNGDGTFSEITDSPLTNTVFFSEGSCWADWDNDGDLDLLVSAGGNQSNGEVHMYENDGSGNFTEIEDGELTALVDRYEGMSCFDYDQDGDLDVFICNYFDKNNLLYNNNGNDNRWVSISLTGTVSNTNAIGAKVYVKAVIWGEEVWQLREVITHSGHVTQGSLKAHFGLGDATSIDSVIIVWPTQEEHILTNVQPNQFLHITEMDITAVDEAPVLTKQSIDLRVIPNPLHQKTSISFTLKKSASVVLEVVDLAGRPVHKIFSGRLPSGTQTFDWNTHNTGFKIPIGNYIISLVVDNVGISEKITLVE